MGTTALRRLAAVLILGPAMAALWLLAGPSSVADAASRGPCQTEAITADDVTPALVDPVDVAADEFGNVFILDQSNLAVYKFDLSRNQTTLVEQADTTPNWQDPTGIEVDGSGNVYVADANFGDPGMVYRFDADGNQTLVIESADVTPALVNPVGVAVDDTDGTFYVSDWATATIHKFDSAGNQTGTIPPSAGTPFVAFPYGLTVDDNGNIHVAAGDSERIYEFDPAGNQVSTIDKTAATPQFDFPTDVAVDDAGETIVTDPTTGHIYRFDAGGNQMSAVPGSFAEPGTPSLWSLDVAPFGGVWVAGSTGSRAVHRLETDFSEIRVSTEPEYRAALDCLSDDPTDPGPHTIRLTESITVDDGTDPTFVSNVGAQLSLLPSGLNRHQLDAEGQNRILDSQTTGRTFVQSLDLEDGFAGPGDPDGGAINADGDVSLIAVIAFSNEASGDGGAVHAGADIVSSTSVFGENEAGDDGGALSASGGTETLVSNSVFNANQAGNRGGAIRSDSSALLVTGSDFAANEADLEGGAISATAPTIASTALVDNVAERDGGAVAGTNVVIRSSTLRGNEALNGGAIRAFQTTTIEDSSISDNTAVRRPPDATPGVGGAVSAGTSATLVDTTLADNEAEDAGSAISAGSADLTHVTIAGAISSGGEHVAVTNLSTDRSVVTRRSGSGAPGGGDNCSVSGSTTTGGNNYADDETCGLVAESDSEALTNDPRLGVLRDNGDLSPPGLTEGEPRRSMFPLFGSPLIDVVGEVDCVLEPPELEQDQRGVDRPFADECDIGAIEAVYPPHGLTDVPRWVETAVRWITSGVNEPRLMEGYPDLTFRDTLPITRAQFVRLMYREAGAPDVSGMDPHGLSDVPAWVEDAVRWAVDGEVMTGYPNDTFRPNLSITRAQVTRAKYRFAGSQDTAGFGPHGYSDVPAWIETAVTWAAHHELVSGYANDTYRPDNDMTRGQVTRLDERLGISPWAWDDPDTAPPTLPFRPD